MIGPVGPVGPAGPPLVSIDALAGLACTRSGQAGTVSLTYSASGDITLNCAVAGNTTGPVLASLTPSSGSVQIGNQLVMTVTTSGPVAADLPVGISVSDGTVASAASPTILSGTSSATFALTGLAAGSVTVTASASGSSLTAHVQVLGADQLDSDHDGIPDALDPCPMIPNTTINGVSYCPAVVYHVNELRLALGTQVAINNLEVTAVNGTQMTIATVEGDFVYEPGATYGSAITVELGALTAPAVGSRINVLGMIIPGFTPYYIPGLDTAFYPPTIALTGFTLISVP